eukprot:421163-Pyramimonas_sp.AAC.1
MRGRGEIAWRAFDHASKSAQPAHHAHQLWLVRRAGHVATPHGHGGLDVRRAHAQQEFADAPVADHELTGLLRPVAEDVEPGEE